jgi:hypothetical protein
MQHFHLKIIAPIDTPSVRLDTMATVVSPVTSTKTRLSTLSNLPLDERLFKMPACSWFKLPLKGIRPLVVVLCTVTLSLPAFAQTPPLFPLTATFPIGGGQVVATGDFNGDGQTDLASISLSSTSTTLVVFLNQGATTPPSPVTTTLNFPVFAVSHAVAVDINNDKNLDLVVTTSTSVNVFLGNGDGTFQTPVSYAVSNAGNLTSVDLNGDGYPDLALVTTSVQTSANLIVFLNQGSSNPGALSSPVLYPVSLPIVTEVPQNIATGDFNGDGKPDLVVGDTQLTVFYGNGDGSLQAPYLATQAPVTPVGPSDAYGDALFVAADLNHDGITDIAYLTNNLEDVFSNAIHVILGQANGKFTTGPSLFFVSSLIYPTQLVAAGTANGNVDLAVVTDKTKILLGDGKGGFVQGHAYAFNGTLFPVPGDNNRTDLISELTHTDPLSISPTSSSVTRLASNGDGTFQALPTLRVSPFGFLAVDLNGDGLTDVLSIDQNNSLVTALGRGNGTFTVTSSISGTQAAPDIPTPGLAADFTGDGIVDALTITPGNGSPRSDSSLIFFKGNGDGSFQAAGTPIDLGIYGSTGAVSGDFNGDGRTDILVAAAGSTTSALFFFPGKGDGTFGSASPLPSPSPQPGSAFQPLILTADLNNDHKLDVIAQGNVFLGQGDGTFVQSSVNLPGTVLAVGDLNGDGIPDLVVYSNNVGATVYAGNGDGTFQSSPFYTAALPPLATDGIAIITDTNADGHPDLVLQSTLTSSPANTTLTVFLGDGKGNFTPDSNIYYAGSNPSPEIGFAAPVTLFPARLNNQAPQGAKDLALDLVTFTNGGATSLLNQTNPAPTTPALLPSKTALTASSTTAAPGQQLTFTARVTGGFTTGSVTFTAGTTTLGAATVTSGIASLSASFAAVGAYAVTATYTGDINFSPSTSNSVSVGVAQVSSTTTLSVSSTSGGTNQQLTFTASVAGLNPSGKVTFTSASGTLGTATLTNGTASLSFAFTAVGSYVVTANYAGDAANLPSSSTPLTVTIATPDYTLSTSPSSATIAAGKSATTTLTVTPVGGYSGTVKLSCGPLASGITCTFAPVTVTPSNGAATTTLTVATTAATSASLKGFSLPLPGIAWAGLTLLLLSPRRIRGLNHRLLRASLLIAVIGASLLSFSGCSSSSPSNTAPTNPGTPVGAQTIILTAADSSGNLSHTINFQVTVQ